MYLSSAVSTVSLSVRKHFAGTHLDKSHFRSRSTVVLRVDPLRLIIPSAAEESQHRICCVVSLVSSELHPKLQQPVPLLSQARALTSSRVQRPTQLRHCCVRSLTFLLDAVIGYHPSLPRNHDGVPLTLNRSASPAQSESRYVNTEPTGGLFTASRLSVVGRTGFPRRYRRIDLMFLMSVSLACPRLYEAFPIAQRKSARSILNSFHQAVGRFFVRLQASLSHLSPGVLNALLVSSGARTC